MSVYSTSVNQLIKISLTAITCVTLAACSNAKKTAPIVEIPVDSSNYSVKTSTTSQNLDVNPTTLEEPEIVRTSAPVATSSTSTRSESSSSFIGNNRDYQNIAKGSYQTPAYTVQKGDTLYYIAWIAGKTVDEIKQINQLNTGSELSIGQVIKTGNTGKATAVTKPTTTQVASTTTSTAKPIFQSKPTSSTTSKTIPAANTTANKTITTTTKPTITNSTETKAPASSGSATSAITTTTTTITKTEPAKTVPAQTGSANVANITWRWPTTGNIIVNYSAASKGIDIAGKEGQAITAAADGVIMYEGNALPGYGNLIIIKHNSDYLTAYAHNNKILVKEKDTVKAGQKIAEMGSTGTTSPRLHFEVRYKANAVDPMRFLPKK